MKDIPYVQVSRQSSSWSFALGILPLSEKKKLLHRPPLKYLNFSGNFDSCIQDIQ